MKRCGHEIKLIISDIDGTLLTSENVLLSSTESAVRKMIEAQNCAFTISTGRPFISTNPLAKYLGLKAPFSFSGGAIYDPLQENAVFAPAISQEQLEKITTIAHKYKVGILAHTTDGLFCLVNDKDWQTIRAFEWVQGKQFELPERIEDIRTDVPDKIIRLDLFAEVDWLSDVWQDVQKEVPEVDSIKMFRSIEIFEKGMDKGSALRRIAKQLNIPLENTMAIGDSLNDVPLLTSAGFGIAMDTAPQALKNIADAVVPSSDEDGLVKALQMISQKSIF